MRQTSLEPLSPEIESLLAKEREIEPQSAELRARAMTRARAAEREIAVSTTWSPWRQRAALLVAAALLLAGAAVAIAALRRQPPAVDERSSTLEHASKASESREHLTPPPVTTTEPSPDVPKGEVKPVPEKGPVAASRSTPSNADALELGLLQRARANVARGDFAGALDAIGEHERRFPAGRLREEREALRVKALSGLGKNGEARAAAEKFKTRYPRSVLSASIEEATRPRP